MSVLIPNITIDSNKKVVVLNNNQGFGLEDNTQLEVKKKFAIRVSDKISYQITFWFKQDTVNPTLELSMRSFNCNFEREYVSKDVLTGQNTNFFITPHIQLISNQDKYYYARYILYSSDFNTVQQQPKTSLAGGTNLIMSQGVSNIFINLACRNLITNEIRKLSIWDFKVRPLSTPFSTGFIQSTNLLEIWRKNNRKDIENNKIDNIAENYLLPYNSIQAVIKL